MHKYQNTGQLITQIDELKKEVSVQKGERKALFFSALCGASYAVLQFSPVAATILLLVSFSLCFLEDIVKGEKKVKIQLFSVYLSNFYFVLSKTFEIGINFFLYKFKSSNKNRTKKAFSFVEKIICHR